MSDHEGYDLAYEYTVRFYPRYFSWVQFNINKDNSQGETGGENYENRLTGPLGMGPEYKVVVAINDDTIYAEAFLDVSNGPVILTFPAYANSYSILQLDVYGNIFSTELSTRAGCRSTAAASRIRSSSPGTICPSTSASGR